MSILAKILLGGYSKENWRYLAQSGGNQLAKRKRIPRPVWLSVIYIAMMSIGFWEGGLGLPWFTKYLIQIGVVGIAAAFLLVTGDFGRLDAIGEYYAMSVIPFVLMAVWSMLIWALDFQKLNYISRGCSTILYQVISLTFVCAAVYLFGGKAVDYTMYGMCFANAFIVLKSILTYGLREFITGFAAFAKSGGIDTEPAIKALEVHDLTFGFGLMLLYYGLYEKGWKRVIHFLLAVIFFYLGLKRIALVGLFGVGIMYFFVQKSNETGKRMVIHTIFFPAIAGCFFYVFLIRMGIFSRIVDTLAIDTMGRTGLYEAFRGLYSFGPTFRGYGIGWVTRYISIMTENKVGIFASHYFGAMHNDIVAMYIELGFWGFALWLWYSWRGKVVWCQKRYGTETALLLLYGTIYSFVTYATDNTAFYCYINTVFMLLPLAHAVRLQEANEVVQNDVKISPQKTGQETLSKHLETEQNSFK